MLIHSLNNCFFNISFKEAPRDEADILWDWKPDESTSLSPLPGSRIKKLLNLRALQSMGRDQHGAKTCCSPVHPGIQSLSWTLPFKSSGALSVEEEPGVLREKCPCSISTLFLRCCGALDFLSRWLGVSFYTRPFWAYLCCCCGHPWAGEGQRAARVRDVGRVRTRMLRSC